MATDLPEVGDLIQQVNSLTGVILTGLVIDILRRPASPVRVRYFCLRAKRLYGIEWQSYTGKYWKVISHASLTSE